jgi:hypothetical protein
LLLAFRSASPITSFSPATRLLITVFTDYDVVQNLYSDKITDFLQSLGNTEVFCTWRRVSRRVIMDQNNSYTPVVHGRKSASFRPPVAPY